MQVQTQLNNILGIEFPMIMAPMFLVSNEAMVLAAMQSGIAGTFPSLNYREEAELEKVIQKLNNAKASLAKGTYGVNLIVQQSNIYFKKHLEICVKNQVPFYITSLGNPKEVIEKAHAYGAKVFCDVTNIEHAKKAFDADCDGFLAVGQGAGGHAGPFPLHILISSLKKHFPAIPVIAAGGIAHGEAIVAMLALGAAGVSVGTRFIASKESTVNDEYKNAIVSANMNDIVLTTKISGTPCTIIDTPYAKKIGYKQNWLERVLSTNSKTKKYFKMLVQWRGMKWLEQSAGAANYKSLWCAGQSVEMIEEILSVDEICKKIKTESEKAYSHLIALRKG
jgi:nitronate monooxygenase